MTPRDEIYERLFNQSGCLKLESLKRFSSSGLSEQEKHLIESHLKNCELCSDALEGLNLVTDKEKLSSIITEINDNLQKSILSKEPSHKTKSVKISDRILYFSIAASVLILIGFFSYFKYYWEKPVSDISVLTDKSSENVNIQSPQNSNENNQEVPSEEIITEPNPNNLNQNKQETSEEKIYIEPETGLYEPEIFATEISDDIMPVDESVSETDMIMEQPTSEALANEASVSQPVYIGGVIVSEREESDSQAEGAGIKPATYKEIGSQQTKKKAAIPEATVPLSNRETPREDTDLEDGYISPTILELEDEYVEQEVIFTVVEVMPEFPGGDEELFRYLHKNLNYPNEARDSAIQGRVYISFIVEEDGRVSDVRVLRGIGGGCDEEAVRVIAKMPEWAPGYQRGKPVRVQYNMPIIFKLN